MAQLHVGAATTSAKRLRHDRPTRNRPKSHALGDTAVVGAFTPAASGQRSFHTRYDVVLVREDGAIKSPGVGYRDSRVGDPLYGRLELRDRVAAGNDRRYLAAEPAAPDGLVDYDQPPRLADGL